MYVIVNTKKISEDDEVVVFVAKAVAVAKAKATAYPHLQPAPKRARLQ